MIVPERLEGWTNEVVARLAAEARPELLRYLVETQRGARKSAARASFVYAQLAGARSAEVGGLIERHDAYLVSDHASLRV